MTTQDDIQRLSEAQDDVAVELGQARTATAQYRNDDGTWDRRAPEGRVAERRVKELESKYLAAKAEAHRARESLAVETFITTEAMNRARGRSEAAFERAFREAEGLRAAYEGGYK